MFKTFVNAWKIEDVRKKILFTFLIIVLYRIGANLPIPFLSSSLETVLNANAGSIFSYLNILSGSAFSQATLFALGVSPYITSQIVIQLLTVAIPALERLSKEEDGRKKIDQYTRIGTILLAIITSVGYYFLLKSYNLLTNTGFFAALVIVTCYCSGSSLVMWLAEKINDYGIGNGVSMILFANILSRGASIAGSFWSFLTNGTVGGVLTAVLGLVIALAMIWFIVFVTESERRLPIQYAKKVVGRKMYGGQNSTLPIKVNNVGVMPIIFASSILSIIPTIGMFVNPAEGSFWAGFFDLFSSDHWVYIIFSVALIILFAFFYIQISFNPVEVANNLKQNGGFVPGIRPGRPTAEYIKKILYRVTLIGAICLAVIDIIPLLINVCSGGTMKGIAFGGTSIIIVVGVILETVREMEAQMTMRHYKGFLN
ncbi:MAG: preprotein translocase subunit SecY [Clostridia bacterium]|nr:preprotein translocase subunit SecY [Clostridia bacterium]